MVGFLLNKNGYGQLGKEVKKICVLHKHSGEPEKYRHLSNRWRAY